MRLAAGDFTTDESGLEISAYPNPASQFVTLVLGTNKAQNASIAMYDSQGKKVYSSKQILQEGETAVRLNVSEMAPGLYHIKVHTEQGEYKTTSILIQHS
ncbi:MAG: T9SS type A sorting domain-containing protein [Bacteroidia bacterium]